MRSRSMQWRHAELPGTLHPRARQRPHDVPHQEVSGRPHDVPHQEVSGSGGDAVATQIESES